MSGVEILATEEVAVAWGSFNWHNFWLVFAVGIGIALFFGFIFGLNENDFVSACIIFIVIAIFVCGVFGPIIGKATAEPTEYKTQYKVIIDETVSLIEFNEKYEIIDQDGKIYIVEERD